MTDLVMLNGIKPEYAPTIKRGDIESVDLGKLGSFLSQMASAGFITPDDETENHLRDVAGVPKREAQEQPAGGTTDATDATDDTTAVLDEEIELLGAKLKGEEDIKPDG